MLCLYFISHREPIDAADRERLLAAVRAGLCPAAERVYIDASGSAAVYAETLFPQRRPVALEALGAPERSTGAFDALLGNFRVLYQDAEREVTIAFILPEASIASIFADRMTAAPAGGDKKTVSAADEDKKTAAPGGSDSLFLTHADGGRLVLDGQRVLIPAP